MQFGGDVDAAFQTACHRAEVGVESVYALGCIPVFGRHFQGVGGVNTLDDEDIAIFFDFRLYVG